MPLSRRTIKLLFGTAPVEEGNSFGRPESVAFRLPVSSSLDFQKRVRKREYFVITRTAFYTSTKDNYIKLISKLIFKLTGSADKVSFLAC